MSSDKTKKKNTENDISVFTNLINNKKNKNIIVDGSDDEKSESNDVDDNMIVNKKKLKKEELLQIQYDEDLKELSSYIESMHKKNIIDDNELNTLEYFIKCNCPITQAKNIKSIIEKYEDQEGADKLLFKIRAIAPHFINKKKDLKDVKYNVLNMIDTTWSDDQVDAITKIVDFLYNPDMSSFGLYGYAGTGKTTCLVSIIVKLISMKYINSVAFSAPTNKAVNILKSKFYIYLSHMQRLGDKTINIKLIDKMAFLTLHRLLNYDNEFTDDGERKFVKTKKSAIQNYDLVIVDETSMVQHANLKDLKHDLENNGIFVPKLIYAGDPAQLPPVNEDVSPLFLDLLSNNVNNKDALKIYKKYKPDDTQTLKIVMRSDNTNITDLCYNIRQWVLKEISTPDYGKFKGDKVKYYSSLQPDRFINTFLNKNYINTSIILTWTNEKVKEYNNIIRTKYFSNKKELDKFEIGDKLIVNEFYKVPDLLEDEITEKNSPKFYTSEPISINNVITINKIMPSLPDEFPADTKVKIKNRDKLVELYKKTIADINNKTKRKYKTYKIMVNKQTNDINDALKISPIYVIHDDSKEILENDREISKDIIKEFKNACINLGPNIRMKQVEKHIIKKLWKIWHCFFNDYFASVDYGYATTCHTSQGSTYLNVFVDGVDILKNKNLTEGRRCFYTAITRTSNELHIMLLQLKK